MTHFSQGRLFLSLVECDEALDGHVGHVGCQNMVLTAIFRSMSTVLCETCLMEDVLHATWIYWCTDQQREAWRRRLAMESFVRCTSEAWGDMIFGRIEVSVKAIRPPHGKARTLVLKALHGVSEPRRFC